jgi:hypothetical protein
MRALPLVKRCAEDFGAMKDGHCERCNVRVRDLSAGTEEEAAALVASPDVECIRFAVDRRSGNIRFRAAVASAVAITVAASSVALAASSPPSQKQSPAPDAGDASPDVEYYMGR